MQPVSFVCLITCLMVFISVLVLSIYIYAGEYKSFVARKKGMSDPRVDGVTCKPGDCVTNVRTGIKRCPVDDEPEPFDPATEACNERFSCTSPRTPYPVSLNGHTLDGKSCPDGVACNCFSTPSCPSDRATVWMVSDSMSSPRAIAVRNDGGVKIPPGYSLICSAPQELSQVIFGCYVSDKKSMYKCLSGSKASSACNYGIAAVSMPKRGISNTATTAYCIHSRPCTGDRVKFYDPRARKALCLGIDETGSTI